MENKPKNNSIIFIIVAIFAVVAILNIFGAAAKGQLNLDTIISAVFDQGIFFFIIIIFILKGKKNLSNSFLKKIQDSINKSGGSVKSQTSEQPVDLMGLINQVMNQPAIAVSPNALIVDEGVSMPGDSSIVRVETSAVTTAPAANQLISLANLAWLSLEPVKKLNRKNKYLQIALNGSLSEARKIIAELPRSEKIIVEAGTPLIKSAGTEAVRTIRRLMPSAYIVADIKTADLATREVEMFKSAGANAVTALGVAPIETLNEFITACRANNLDAMIDMMNVESSIAVLKKLKNLPEVVILHRGVDETEASRGKMIPYYQINQIKGNYNLMVSVAGGDTSNEIESAVFNGANIVVVWKDFISGGGVRAMAENFLKMIK